MSDTPRWPSKPGWITVRDEGSIVFDNVTITEEVRNATLALQRAVLAAEATRGGLANISVPSTTYRNECLPGVGGAS